MTEKAPEKTPLKEYLDGLNKSVSTASAKVGSQLSNATRQIGDAAKRAAQSTRQAATRTGDAIKTKVDDSRTAREAKRVAKAAEHAAKAEPSSEIPIEDGGAELPAAPKLPTLMDSVDMATPYSLDEVRLSREEYEKLSTSLGQVAEQQAQIESLVGDIQLLTNQLVSLEEVTNQFDVEEVGGSLSLVDISGRDRGLVKSSRKASAEGLRVEMSRSFNHSLTLLGFSVVWLGALVGADYYVTQQGWAVAGFSADIVTWSIGTSLWSLAVLTRLHTARTFLAMSWGMRIQSSVGIGLATTMALILTTEQYATIGNVWGWGATIALTALLLSGLARGLAGSTRRLFRRKTRSLPDVQVIDVDGVIEETAIE